MWQAAFVLPRSALSSVSLGLFACCFHLLGLLQALQWPVSCMWQGSRKIGRIEERGFLLSFLRLLPIRRKAAPRRPEIR